jgi:site-specific DNA-methyltransferase (adenine-specific)
MSIGIRAAGFENRDTIASQFGPSVLQWVYGSGMPKSHNVSKALDRLVGAEREIIGTARGKGGQNGNKLMRRDGNDSEDAKGCGAYVVGAKQVDIDIPVTVPATDEAKKWEGYGTALKPAWEPVVMFRKTPQEKTVAAQILKTGTGAINIDASRVKHASKADLEKHAKGVQAIKERGGSMENSWKNSSDLSGANDVTDAGRWPANVLMVHSDGCVKGDSWHCVEGCPVLALDTQSGDRPSTLTGRADPSESHQHPATARPDAFFGNIKGGIGNVYADSGGASRFFQQFEGQPEIEVPFYYSAKSSKKDKTSGGKVENLHPTTKPTALMAYLVKMVTPAGGLVLDPYCGSGTTCVAAVQQGFQFVGIERDEQWVPTARARIEHSKLPEPSTSEDGELDFEAVAAMMSDD